jgi:hypothetical protein
VLMLIAAAGALPPVWGAVAQEVIDVAAIANALRALRPGGAPMRQRPASERPRPATAVGLGT